MAPMRLSLLLLLAGAGLPGAAAAQRVSLEVRLSSDTTVDGRRVRLPEVRTVNLLRDSRWEQSLRNSLPLRLQFTVEVWRSRDSWIDQFERASQWEVVIRHEALFDQYSVAQRTAGGTQESTFPTWEAIEIHFNSWNRIITRPATTGTYYYTVKLTISTLSEADLDELERYLQGQAVNEAERERQRGSGQAWVRFLLRMAGALPSQTLERRSPRFEVR